MKNFKPNLILFVYKKRAWTLSSMMRSKWRSGFSNQVPEYSAFSHVSVTETPEVKRKLKLFIMKPWRIS